MHDESGKNYPYFTYNEEAASIARNGISASLYELGLGLIGEDGIPLFSELMGFFILSIFEGDTSEGYTSSENADLFFALAMEVGKCRPGLFATADVSLLAANIAMIRCKSKKTKTIACLDWTLLPVAILLAGQGFHITLPHTSTYMKEAKSLSSIFTKYLAGSKWTEQETLLSKDAFFLGSTPVEHTESDPQFLHNLSGMAGIIYCYWDFLNVTLHEHIRERWVASGLIRSVIQLPRPRRQSAYYYPALLELDGHQSRKNSSIRLINIKDSTRGPGGLSQEKALHLLLNPLPKDCSSALDVRPEELRIHGSLDLKPSWHIARHSGSAASGSVRLSDVAQVIRCQLPRTKLSAEELDMLLQEEEMLNKSFDAPQPDGSFICREILLNDLDTLTGFVKQRGELTRVHALNPTGRQGKYLLQPDDILMAFRGAESSLGSVGFMETDFERPAITGQSMCTIRAYDVDNIWLYYALQEYEIRQAIVAQASGGKTLTVNLTDLRNLLITLPSKEEVDLINEKHIRLTTYIREMETLERKVRGELKNIREEFSLQENMRNRNINQGPIKGRP